MAKRSKVRLHWRQLRVISVKALCDLLSDVVIEERRKVFYGLESTTNIRYNVQEDLGGNYVFDYDS